MTGIGFTGRFIGVAVAMVVAVAGVSTAQAQRTPEYAAARAAGQVGEQRDGYLGVIGGGADISAMVRDINNKRRSVYTTAAAGKSTIEEYAFTTGCKLIRDTKPGEKYQGLDGSWKTRGGGDPELDPRCP